MNQQSTYPATIDAFKQLVSDFKATASYKEPLLFAVGSRVFTGNGTLASVRYPVAVSYTHLTLPTIYSV